MTKVVIAGAARRAIGSFGGSLAKLSAVDLGAQVVRGLLEKTGVQPTDVDEVILGQVLTAGCGQNPARQTTLKAGLPETVPAMTINKVCGSGLKAVHLAAQSIANGDADIVIAGGQESMSQSAHVLPGSRDGVRMGDWKAVDTMITDGLWDAFNGYHMGITAENVADKYEISRQAQDEFAAASQAKAAAAREAGKFVDEIVPIEIPQRKGDPIVFAEDEYIKPGSSAEKLSGLRPAFKKDGSVTAGNASGLNDGAAVLLVCSEQKARELGLPILATIASHASSGVDPAIMGTGPIPASTRALEKAGWTHAELDLIEANEAFAAQAMGEIGRAHV